MLACYRSEQTYAPALAAGLGVSSSRFFILSSEYLRAFAQGRADTWSSHISGGNHCPVWPEEATALLKQLLSCKPSSSYSAAASVLHHRISFQTDRASIRRLAIQNRLAPDTRYKQTPKPVKRWRVPDLGALWQDDASPHRFLPHSKHKQTLLNLPDDATCYKIGARLYHNETPASHLDFLDKSFRTRGLPLASYIDYHYFFFTHTPEAFTQLGAALHFYGIALRFAQTPSQDQNRTPPLILSGPSSPALRRRQNH